MVLQEAAEYYLTSFLEDANLCAIQERWMTIMLCDIQLIRKSCEKNRQLSDVWRDDNQLANQVGKVVHEPYAEYCY